MPGRTFTPEGGNGSRHVQSHVKAGVVQKCLGVRKASFNGRRFTSDLDGTRVRYGLGMDWQTADSLRLHLQAGREEGDGFTRGWQVSAGLTFAF